MKSFITVAALAAGSNALVSRGDNCCFHLDPSGDSTGFVGQLSDGQNRIGDNRLSPAQFCIDSNGAITDGNGRGCILTPPTTQFQCDVGATPTPGFSVNSDGVLEFHGSPDFIACETGDNGGLNIHTTESNDLGNCKKIQLKADSCSGPTSPPPGPSGNNGCGTILSSGSFEFPHLIVPINSDSPDTAHGTQFNGTVSSSISSIFNFDIPQSDSGKTCSLVFLFPKKEDLETSSFSFSGDGKIDVAKLSDVASSMTTFNNAPSVEKDLGDITISPGGSNVVSTFSCPAGQTIAFELKNAGSTDLNFFQDFNPAP
ncbi:hypothetical protein N7532_000953 [Penicillium argentinense]|uniref:Ubiquitin 3 binding protein But2 C-terminal domain-containing protein n=1 Tax=Penicillium argentinense TaxID=1131581 RepID=A0A9W9G1T9_9EURO|nr:uncharacterized protein N7532_000953 [Penicillium argentinense]KAJ5110418.1 hypothetical protein N7532_000953 [Penicillium argentinense]